MAQFIVEGQTAPVDYRLLADNSAYNLTGCTVSLTAFTFSGAAKTFAGVVSVPNAANGEVRFSPDAADFLSSDRQYRIRFRVVRADAKIEFFPTGEAEVWVVQR